MTKTIVLAIALALTAQAQAGTLKQISNGISNASQELSGAASQASHEVNNMVFGLAKDGVRTVQSGSLQLSNDMIAIFNQSQAAELKNMQRVDEKTTVVTLAKGSSSFILLLPTTAAEYITKASKSVIYISGNETVSILTGSQASINAIIDLDAQRLAEVTENTVKQVMQGGARK